MQMTRGAFLRSLVVGAGAGLSSFLSDRAHASADGEAPRGKRPMEEQLSKEAFGKNLNTKFRILAKTSPAAIDADLVEVKEGRAAEGFEQFSLLFAGPNEPQLAQQTFSVEHPAMGCFDLFLVPLGTDKRGALYEAIFNRTRP